MTCYQFLWVNKIWQLCHLNSDLDFTTILAILFFLENCSDNTLQTSHQFWYVFSVRILGETSRQWTPKPAAVIQLIFQLANVSYYLSRMFCCINHNMPLQTMLTGVVTDVKSAGLNFTVITSSLLCYWWIECTCDLTVLWRLI